MREDEVQVDATTPADPSRGPSARPSAQGPLLPPDRYGPPRRRLGRRGSTLAAAGAILAGVGFAAWAAFGGAADVAWRDLGYVVRSDVSTRVTFEVTMDPGSTAVCTVRALNLGFAEVGLVEIEVGPSPSRSVRAVADVPTSEKAVTGVVKDCAVTGS